MSKFTRGFLSVLASAVLFGMAPLITRVTDEAGVSPYMIVLLKSVIITVLLGAFLCFTSKAAMRLARRDILLLALLGFLRSMTEVLLFMSYRYISTGNATAIHFSYPLFILLFGALFYRDKITKKNVICFVVCTAGIALLFRPGEQATLQGYLMTLASGICFALFSLLVDKYEVLPRIGNLRMTVWNNLFSIVFLLPFCLLTGNFELNLTVKSAGFLLLLTLVDGVIAMMLLQSGIRYISSRAASLISVLEPVTSIAVGALALNETLTAASVIGSALILLAAVLLVVFERKPPQEASEQSE